MILTASQQKYSLKEYLTASGTTITALASHCKIKHVPSWSRDGIPEKYADKVAGFLNQDRETIHHLIKPAINGSNR